VIVYNRAARILGLENSFMSEQASNSSSNTQAPETAQNDNLTNKVVTIAAIGVAVALIEVELIPGMLLGIGAALLPGFLPKLGDTLRPMVKSTVRASYAVAQKTREVFAEAHEQVQDMVAEAKMEHQTAGAPVNGTEHA